MHRKFLSKGFAAGVAVSLVLLAGCDLQDTTDVPTQPGDAPGSKSQIFLESDWADERPGTLLSDSADWFRLDLKTDSMYSITAEGVEFGGAGTADVKIEVYGSALYQVYTSAGAAGGAKSARLVFKSPLTGPVRVRISNPAGATYGKYSAKVRREDQYEPDGTIDVASPIVANGSLQAHRISEPDTDWVKVTTSVGKYYEVRIPGSLVDVDVYDAAKSLVFSPLRFDLNGTDKIWGFTATAATSYIRIVHGEKTSADGVYTLRVLAITDDANEPDDSTATAKSIVFGSVQNRVLLPDSDDWLKFSATKNMAYHVTVTSNQDVSFEVGDLVGNDFGSGTQAKPLALVSTFTEPLYIRVFGSSEVASYSIKVTASDTTLAPADPIVTEPPTGPI